MRKILLFLFLISFNAFSICLPEYEGTIHYCNRIQDTEQDKLCASKHGTDYLAYTPSDECSEVAENYGQEALAENSDEEVQATCMTFEQGVKNNCEFWDYGPAFKYCLSEYGGNYLPHEVTSTCSIKQADKLYGFISSSELVEGFDTEFMQAESVLSLLDKKDLNSALGDRGSNRPAIDGDEFYTEVVTGLIKKLKRIKKSLYKRSHFKIKISEETPSTKNVFSFVELNQVKPKESNLEQFRNYLGRYLGMLSRLQGLYVYIAHQDKLSLKPYDIEELSSSLNLVVSRIWGLEILAKYNLRSKHLNENKDIEFFISEQEKQVLEYTAMSEPSSKEDYAKLISFMGARENFTNLWALDRLTTDNLLNTEVRSCGDFLSYKANGKNASQYLLMKELAADDTYIHDLRTRMENITKVTKEVSLIKPEIMTEILVEVASKNITFKKLLKESGVSEDSFGELFSEDVERLQKIENLNWNLYSTNYPEQGYMGPFNSVLLTGDDIKTAEAVIERITQVTYNKRREFIVNDFLSSYPWMGDAVLGQIKKTLNNSIDIKLKDLFKTRINSKLSIVLESYGDKEILHAKLRDDKISKIKSMLAPVMAPARAIVDFKNTYVPLHRIAPATVEELLLLFNDKIERDFHDIKLTLKHVPKLAEEFTAFVTKMTEKFNTEYLVLNPMTNESSFKGTEEQRIKALRSIFIEVANEYYEANKFNIAQLAMVPNAVLLARNHQEIAQSPYTVQVYRDGTPVTLSITQFYDVFKEKLGLEDYVRREESIPAITSIFSGTVLNLILSSKKTDGSFNRPLEYIKQEGRKVYPNEFQDISLDALQKLYYRSLDSTYSQVTMSVNATKKIDNKEELERTPKWYNKIMDKIFGAEGEVDEDDLILTPQKFFARIFEAFNISVAHVGRKDTSGYFVAKKKDELFLAHKRLAELYQREPLLKIRLETVDIEERQLLNNMGMLVDTYEEEVIVQRPLLLKIAKEAYTPKGRGLDLQKTETILSAALKVSQKNVQGKLNDFCSSSYKNYKTDTNFKRSFKSARFLRETLKSDLTTTKMNAHKIKNFDKEIGKEIRSTFEAFNEDYAEPIVITMGTIAIGALAIMFALGSFGTAVPAIGVLMGMIPYLLVAEMYFSFPFAMSYLGHRLNSQFIEVPASIQYQKAIATSQIDQAKIVDWEMLESLEKQNNTAKIITVVTLPFDIWYGHMIGSHLKRAAGITGKQAYKRLTGLTLNRSFSRPPISLGISRTFKEQVRENGIIRGTKYKTSDTYKRFKSLFPRIQNTGTELLGTNVLRSGLVRKLKDLNYGANPWQLVDDIKAYHLDLTSRTKILRQVYDKDQGFINKTILNKGLKFGEAIELGVGKTRIFYLPKSYLKAMWDNKLFFNYIQKYGEILGDLKSLQGQFIESKIIKFENMIETLETAQRGAPTGPHLIDDMIRRLDDDELMLLQDIAKYGNLKLRGLKKVYKDFETVTQTIRPAAYLNGAHAGSEFGEVTYPSSPLMAQKMHVNNYIYRNEAEDIVNFYESMVRQGGKLSKAGEDLKIEIEHKISHLYRVTEDGSRLYINN